MNPSVFILEDNKLFAQNLVDMIGQYPLKLNCIVTSDLATAMAQLNDSIHYTAFLLILRWMKQQKIQTDYRLQNIYLKALSTEIHRLFLQQAFLIMYTKH